MSSAATHTIDPQDKWDSDGRIVFMAVVFAILFMGVWPKLFFNIDLGIKRIEPFLFAVSIGSTALFSYLFIFGFEVINLKGGRIVITLAFLVNLVLAFSVTILSLFDMYGLSGLRDSLLSLNLRVINWLLDVDTIHIFVFVFVLTIIDVLIWLFNEDPNTKLKYRRIFYVTDIPTLCGILTVLAIQFVWRRQGWDGIRAQTFEAGAITFQLLAANVQIIASDLIARRGAGLQMTRRPIFIAGFAVLLAAVLYGPVFGADSDVTQTATQTQNPAPPPSLAGTSITINIATWPGFAPVFIAKERNFFNDLSVTVNVVDDFSARRAAFKSGQADFTVYTVDSLAFDIAAGITGKAILALDQSAGADGIIARAPIRTASDLRKKKIAFTQGSPSHFLLAWYLKNANIPLSAIIPVYVDDPTRAAQAFSGRKVDAAVTWEPNLSQLQKQRGVVSLYTSKDAPNLIVDVLVASQEIVRNKPAVVQVVVDGWLKAIDYYNQNQSAAQAIMAKGLGLSDAELARIMPGLVLQDRTANGRLFPTLKPSETSTLMALFSTAAQLWKDERLTSDQPDARLYLDSEFVQKSN